MHAAELEYCKLTGYITHQSTVRGMTDDGWQVRHTTVVVNLGRSARVPPADPDAAIAPERRTTKPAYAMQAKTRALMAQVQELLMEKPHSAKEMAEALGVTTARVHGLLRGYPDDFEVVSKTGRDGGVFLYGVPADAR